MTYTGLKSMIYAGVKADDPRVKAAVGWVKKHYTLDANPGMPNGQQGLYYYYNTFSKALAAIGMDVITDDQGKAHNWRHDLLEALAKRQKDNGSWVNSADRWMEGDPNLVTVIRPAVAGQRQAEAVTATLIIAAPPPKPLRRNSN